MKNKLNNILDKLKGNKINVLKISTGTLIGQLISIIILPINARIYGAEVIGLWTLVHSFSIIVNSFSDMGLTNTIMTEENENDALNNFNTVSLLSFGFSLIFAIFYFNINGLISGYNQHLILISVLIFLDSFLSQVIQINYTMLNRIGNYSTLMKNPIIHQTVYGGTAIILGSMGYTSYGYFIAQILGKIITLLNMFRKVPRIDFKLRIKNIKRTITGNIRFVKFQLPTNIISNFKDQLPVFLIEFFWGAEILGFYSITVRVLKIPVSLLGTAIGRVYFQSISKLKREGKKIGQYTFNNINKAMKIGVLPIGALMGLGDLLVLIFLGEEWSPAGTFIQILALQYFFMFLMASMRGTTLTLEKQEYSMISNITQAIGFIIGAVIGFYIFDSVYIALITMAVIFVVITITYFTFVFEYMNISSWEYIKVSLISILLIFIIALAIRGIIHVFSIKDLILQIL